MPEQSEPPDLEAVFRDFREEVLRDSELSETERQYKLGLTYREMGMVDDAIRELEWAARSPRLRFEASAIVARLQKEKGNLAAAVDWFERAAEAPAPTPDAGRELLYELAETLEAADEASRALAVYLELQSDAGAFRDVPARIERLRRGDPGS